jgi:hypothetical protein
MRFLSVALLLLPWVAATARAADAPTPFSESAAVLLNVSERDLNRIVVDAFHANGGPNFVGVKERVSSSVADLRYSARFSDPVIRLGSDGTARLSLDILDASLRFGRLERKIGGRQARCEDAGVDVDAGSPLGVDLTFGLAVENGSLRVLPTSVAIPEAEERLRLVEPARCKNTPLPRWFLWWVGKSYFRRMVDRLDEVVLERARTSAARLEEKENVLTKRWEIPKERRNAVEASLRLFPESVDVSGGSVLLTMTASSAGPAALSPAAVRREGARPLPAGSFLGVSESFVNETARRAASNKSSSQRGSTGNFRKLLTSNSVYALIPGLRKIDSKANVYFDVAFPTAPRFEFRRDEGGDAVIRVLLSGAVVNIRKDEGGKKTLLGTLRVESGRMAVVPFTNLLGGISFRMVENRWSVSSTGLDFDEDLVAATLQEIAFGKIFATSYEPLLSRALHLGDTAFVPSSFAVEGRYLLIGLSEPRPPEKEDSAAAAMRTGTLLGSR